MGYQDIPLLVSESNYESINSLILIVIKEQTSERNRMRDTRTPLIPTRILSNLILDSVAHLEKSSPYLDDLINFYKEYMSNPHFWVNQSKDFNRHGLDTNQLWSQQEAISPLEALEKHNLLDFIEQFPITAQNTDFSMPRLIGHLKVVQSSARMLCHAFTGMRNHEVQVLPYDTLERLTVHENYEIPFLRSYTSKIGQDNYSKPTYWVTSEEVESAVYVSQKIAKIAAILLGVECSEDEDFPLFPSLNARVANRDNHIHYDIPLWGDSNPLAKSHLFVNDLKIREEDLAELEIFDMFRDWRGRNEYSVGRDWPIAPHQFRRSLAVYGARSGIVSLPSLGNQYKHMTDVMTALYAENAAFAVNMIDPDGDEVHRDQALLVQEFTINKRINQAINFDQDVMQADGRLEGGMGAAIQRLKDKGDLPEWLSNRKETEKRFRDGRMYYRETTVGGCTSPAPCEKAGLGGVSVCRGCEWAIVGGDDGEKNSAYLESLKLSIAFIDPGTPAYKAVKADIEIIETKFLKEA